MPNKNGKWIQGAVKKPGAFGKYCKGKVSSKCVEKGLHSKNSTTRHRAQFAKNMRAIARKHKR